MHNISIAAETDIEVVKRPHTIAQHVFRARSVISARSIHVFYVMRSVRSADLTTRLPLWDLCDLYDLHMFRRLGSV